MHCFFRLALASAAGQWESENRDTSHDYRVASPWKAACVCVCGIVWGLLAVPRLDPGRECVCVGCGLPHPRPPVSCACQALHERRWRPKAGVKGQQQLQRTSAHVRSSSNVSPHRGGGGLVPWLGSLCKSWSCRVMCLQPCPEMEACAVSRFFQHL